MSKRGPSRLQGEVSALITSGVLSSGFLDEKVDVLERGDLHLQEVCVSVSSKARIQVRVGELLERSCPKCCNLYGLRTSSISNGTLVRVVESALWLARCDDRKAGDGGAFAELARRRVYIRYLARKDWNTHVRAGGEKELRRQEDALVKVMDNLVREGVPLAARKSAEAWSDGSPDCFIGLANWTSARGRGRFDEALELLLRFRIPESSVHSVVSAVPGWAVGFIVAHLGSVDNVEMAEGCALSSSQWEVFWALWPGMALDEAVKSAHVLA